MLAIWDIFLTLKVILNTRVPIIDRRINAVENIFAHLAPQRFRHVHSTAGGALLSVELEGAPDRSVDDRFDVRAGVNEVIILTATLADQFRVVPVFGEILADLRPQAIKRRHRAGEVEPGEVRRGRNGVAEHGPLARDEVYHAWRHPGLPAYLKDPPVGQ